jgi:hypothetical protein
LAHTGASVPYNEDVETHPRALRGHPEAVKTRPAWSCEIHLGAAAPSSEEHTVDVETHPCPEKLTLESWKLTLVSWRLTLEM